MNDPITYQMLSAVVASLVTVGGVWVFIDRRMREVEKEADMAAKANHAELSLLRETMATKYVSNDALIRLEERIVGELRELRRLWERKLFKADDE